MFIERLPPELEDADALITRRQKAAEKKELWRSTYQEAFQYAMPSREDFSWQTEGQKKQFLYDSTLQEATYTAANTLVALLFPSWTRWAELSPGAAIPKSDVTPEIIDGLQKATETFFGFLNTSNFSTVIHEVALDLLAGTCALDFDEGDNDNPFIFSSTPLSAIEIEEGPRGTVESTFMCRKVKARNVLRLYQGMLLQDLSPGVQDAYAMKPEEEVELLQMEVYYPPNKHYYGIVVEKAAKKIVWRYDYGLSCPKIVARATKLAGETYGRGRILLALPDAKTLDRMQEFVLRHAALNIAPPLTGVSDGVLNPYTASLTPNTIIPVASNDNGSPSLRVLDIGGNFQISEAMMTDLRQRVRRIMQGPEPSEGAVKSASEINISDRNRLWAMNGEFGRIQAELLAKIIVRGVFILQKKGLMAKFNVDGRSVVIAYTSPFTKSQRAEDVMALQETLMLAQGAGTTNVEMNLKLEEIPAWVARMKGVPEFLIRNEDERDAVKKETEQRAALAAQMQMQQSNPQQGAQQAPAPQQAGA